MVNDSHLIFENYVDGITRTKNALGRHIMHIANYGIPSREEFIKIRHELHRFTKQIEDRRTPPTQQEQQKGRHMIAQLRAYRSSHPDNPGSYADDPNGTVTAAENADTAAEENAENAQPADVSNEIRIKLGQAHNIVKGLIELLDSTPSGQTPYNEMAITHLVNLQEDLKELSMMLQDRMLGK